MHRTAAAPRLRLALVLLTLAGQRIIAHSGVTENRLVSYREFLWTWGKKGNWALRILPKDSPPRRKEE